MRRRAGGDGVSQPDSHSGEGAGEDPYALPVLVPAKRSSGRVGLRGSFRRRSLSHDVSDPVARARLAPAIPEGAADVSVTRGRADPYIIFSVHRFLPKSKRHSCHCLKDLY